MIRSLLLCPFVAVPPAAAANDPALAELTKAKAAKELTRFRGVLQADGEAKKIRKTRGAGQEIDDLLPERKRFAKNGVVPILPRPLPHSREYLNGVRAADIALQSA